MIERYVLGLEEIDKTQVALVGGKGAHLGELSRIEGIRVPAGFCVTTDAFRRIMTTVPWIDDQLDRLSRLDPDDREVIRTLSTEIRRTLEGIAIPDDLAAAITRSVAQLGEQAVYAVRSSATAEDLPTASFAGQQDTYLNVVGSAAILQHVKRCWASLFTERAVTYRLRNGFDHRKVIGMGGVLDSARFRTFVSLDLGVSVSDVEALVMGGHGDQMVPMPRFTTVKGVPITKLLSPEKITSIIDRTRNGGAEIVSLLKAGSAYYAPAAATYQMLRAILFDERRILPCAAYLTGQYGVRNTYVGVPAVLGKNGVEQVIELELNKQEKKDFDKSLSAVTTLLEKIAI